MRFRAVLFDLDDTLTDRYASLERVAVVFAEHFASELLSHEPAFIARAMRETEGGGYRPRDQFFGDLIGRLRWKESPEVIALAAFWQQKFPECSIEREGVTSLLADLKTRGVRLGVVTNGATKVQQRKVDTLGIRRFLTCVVVSEAVGFKKPDARIFRAALDELAVEPHECLFVGDHPANDVVGSRAAGLAAVWLSGMHSWPPDMPLPQLQIARFAELEQILGVKLGER